MPLGREGDGAVGHAQPIEEAEVLGAQLAEIDRLHRGGELGEELWPPRVPDEAQERARGGVRPRTRFGIEDAGPEGAPQVRKQTELLESSPLLMDGELARRPVGGD